MTIRAIFLLSSSFFSQALLAFPGSTTSPIQFLAYCIFLAFLGIVIQYLSMLSILHVVLDAVELELELEEFSRGAQSGLQLDPAPKSLFALEASRKRQPDRYTILKNVSLGVCLRTRPEEGCRFTTEKTDSIFASVFLQTGVK
jgi:hypothetical protein